MSTDVPAPHDVAIVAMAGRFPGAASVAELWQAVVAGRELVRPLDDRELVALGCAESLLATPGLVRAAGVIPDQAARWADPDDDPQHRLLADVVTEVLDQARDPQLVPALVTAQGAPQRRLSQLAARGAGDASWDELWPSGSEVDHVSGRIAYELDIAGPVLNVGATCAGSLVALATAAQLLGDYQCDLAVAAAVHLTSPRWVARPGALHSPTGRCRPLSAEADGTVMSSAAVGIALKRWEDCEPGEALALLRGVGVSNDGRQRAGYGVPGRNGQVTAVAEALGRAGVGPGGVGLVELHAIGSPLGDALELAALGHVWAQEPSARAVVHAHKATTGNTDVAGGLLALALAVEALRSRTLPPTPHAAPLEHGPFEVLAEARPWPAELPLAASVNSFGVSGTTVHAVVTPAPEVGA